MADGKETKLDHSVLEKDEFFNYLGKKYVKKQVIREKYDKDGNPILIKKWHLDGWEIIGSEKDNAGFEFFGVNVIKTDDEEVLKKYGRPLTTQITYYGPIEESSLFKYDNEPITYDNWDMNEVIMKKGNKLVIETPRIPKKKKDMFK